MLLTDSLIRILSFLYQQKDNQIYASIIAKHTDKTSSYVIKIINDLHSNNLIKRGKNGRIVYLKLQKKA
ncbi:Rrf2 family transcriptional regulator [Candidatus Woesearchaeota archaeon]|nr:Rrf2 family transcriptional regulator [Candidatus Woesearchaeota archaeon]